MQQNNKRSNWPRENKEFKLMAEAWNCFHVCVDRFQVSVWGGGGIWSAESSCYHWQDNMVEEMVCRSWYNGLQETWSFIFCCAVKLYWEWLSAHAWGCIDLCCREPRTTWWKATGNSDFSVFFGPAQKIDKYFIRICPGMKPSNSPRVLHLLWAP